MIQTDQELAEIQAERDNIQAYLSTMENGPVADIFLDSPVCNHFRQELNQLEDQILEYTTRKQRVTH